jgi:S1-C subfamily serine protease
VKKALKNVLIILVILGIAYWSHQFLWLNKPLNAAGAWVGKTGDSVLAWVGGWFGGHEKRKLPAAEIVARSAPAVYRVIAGADLELVGPTAIILTPGEPTDHTGGISGFFTYVPPLVVQYYQEQRAIGNTNGETRGEYCWSLILSDPGRFLQYQNSGTVTVERHDAPFSSATAFAVSPKGILVTNAHVVADCDLRQVPRGGGEPLSKSLLAYYVKRGPLAVSLHDIEKGIGAPCPTNMQVAVENQIKHFLMTKSHMEAPFRRLVVVVNYRPDAAPQSKPFLSNLALLGTKNPFRISLKTLNLNTPSKPIPRLSDYLYSPGSKYVGYYARVLTKGQVYPGKDVAILQLENPKIGASLICLPLANSQNFALGSRVRCFGFPGVAVDTSDMMTTAKYEVTAMAATIDSVEPTLYGWNAFHMESFINHGDSGGPEIDTYGRVVAINDAGLLGTGQNWSIPSNLVKSFLRKAGVKARVGKLSRLWFKGERLYWTGHYRKAETVFFQVLQKQCGENLRPSADFGVLKVSVAAGQEATISNGVPIPKPGGNLLTVNNPFAISNPLLGSPGWQNAPPLANWYVLAAVADCQRHLARH